MMMSKGWNNLRAAALLLGGCMMQTANADVVLVRDGAPAAVVVIADDASATDRHAAQELVSHIEQATGAALEIVSPAEVGGRVTVAVGPGAAAAIAPSVNVAYDDLGNEGILIKTSESALILTGAEGAPRGTIYAVMTFLEDTVGFRWWAADEVHVPELTDLVVGNLDIQHVPAVEYREIHAIDMFDTDTAVRNKLNGPSANIPTDRGGNIIYAGPFFVHTFGPLVPHAELFDQHPEWFSEVNGQRVAPPNHTQLCLTNTELLAYVTAKVRAIAGEVPRDQQAIISVSQDDNQVSCQCAKCVAVEKAEGGTPAGPLLRFVNAIAADIADDYPNIAIDTLAYQYTRKAPTRTKPLPNVIVRLCSYECSFGQPFSDRINAAFTRDVREWSRLTDRLYVWDYMTNFQFYLQPHPILKVLGPNVKFLTDHNVIGLFEQGNRHMRGGEFAVLKNWVLAKLLWNPSLDGDALIAQFVEEYYGPAAPQVQQYIDSLCALPGNAYVGTSNSNRATWMTADWLHESLGLLAEARAAVGDDAVLVHRIEAIEGSVLHAITTNWATRRQLSEMSGSAWPFDEPLDFYVDEMARVLTAQGTPGINEAEFQIDMPAWFAQLKETQSYTAATVPDELRGRKRGDWFDLQQNGLSTHGGDERARRIEDPAASDGYAISISEGHAIWAVQGILHPLPGDGKWTMYAAVRMERTSADGSAFQFGVWDAEGPTHVIPATTVLNSQIPGDDYHYYRLGEVTLSPTAYVWFAPTLNPLVKNIVIDRILFVKEGTSVRSSR